MSGKVGLRGRISSGNTDSTEHHLPTINAAAANGRKHSEKESFTWNSYRQPRWSSRSSTSTTDSTSDITSWSSSAEDRDTSFTNDRDTSRIHTKINSNGNHRTAQRSKKSTAPTTTILPSIKDNSHNETAVLARSNRNKPSRELQIIPIKQKIVYGNVTDKVNHEEAGGQDEDVRRRRKRHHRCRYCGSRQHRTREHPEEDRGEIRHHRHHDNSDDAIEKRRHRKHHRRRKHESRRQEKDNENDEKVSGSKGKNNAVGDEAKPKTTVKSREENEVQKNIEPSKLNEKKNVSLSKSSNAHSVTTKTGVKGVIHPEASADKKKIIYKQSSFQLLNFRQQNGGNSHSKPKQEEHAKIPNDKKANKISEQKSGVSTEFKNTTASSFHWSAKENRTSGDISKDKDKRTGPFTSSLQSSQSHINHTKNEHPHVNIDIGNTTRTLNNQKKQGNQTPNKVILNDLFRRTIKNTKNTENRSKSAGKQVKKQNSSRDLCLFNQGIKAYNSRVKIPSRPKTKQDKSSRSSSALNKSVTASCPSLRSPDHRQQTPSKEREVWSMKNLARFRQTMSVYMDSGWQQTRRDRFYKRLEQAQLKNWKEKHLNSVVNKRKIEESKERQLQQLRHIRHKHQSRRAKRQTTQHVKWKFVLGGDSDRRKYGLPSEYYTYYGFAPQQRKKTNQSKKVIDIPGSGNRKEKTKSSSATSRKSLHPTENDLTDLRRRNKERYSNMFEIGSNRPMKIMKDIIRQGMFTVEIPLNDTKEIKTSKEDTAKNKRPAPLQKRSSKLVVLKDVMDEAKHLLNSLDEKYSEDFDSDSN